MAVTAPELTRELEELIAALDRRVRLEEQAGDSERLSGRRGAACEGN